MSEVSKRYGVIADAFTVRVNGVAPDGWSGTTPCPDWTVGDLVAHVVATHRRVIAMLEGTEPLDVDRGADLAAQWHRATEAMVEALGNEARASTLVSAMSGE